MPDGWMRESWSGEGWIDVSRPLTAETPVWPGDRSVELHSDDDGRTMVSALATTCHAGTHVDAPLHVVEGGIAVHEIPLGRLIGPAEVVRLPADCLAAGPQDLPLGWVPRYPKVLLRTDSHPVDASIEGGFVGASADLVDWLADQGVKTVGIDTPSVDAFSSAKLEAHHALVRRGMTWVEGLDLTAVQAGFYLFVALPLPLRGVEAAPVRALLRVLPESSN